MSSWAKLILSPTKPFLLIHGFSKLSSGMKQPPYSLPRPLFSSGGLEQCCPQIPSARPPCPALVPGICLEICFPPDRGCHLVASPSLLQAAGSVRLSAQLPPKTPLERCQGPVSQLSPVHRLHFSGDKQVTEIKQVSASSLCQDSCW